MRKTLTVLAALAALGATPAMAAGMSTTLAQKMTGTIKSINPTKDELTLQNGKTFTVAKNVSLKNMKPGEKVTVTYTQSGKAMDATQINKAP
jgi:Cu/Ag efflux protein CusF